MSVHSATLSRDEADTFSVLVSSLSATPAASAGPEADSRIVDPDLLDHFALLDDPRDPRWVEHPAAAVLTLCAAAVVAGMRSFTAIAGWVADTPPRLLQQMYQRCGKPALTPSKSTIWQVVTNTDAAGLDTAVGRWLSARADIDVTIVTPTANVRSRSTLLTAPSSATKFARAVAVVQSCRVREETDFGTSYSFFWAMLMDSHRLQRSFPSLMGFSSDSRESNC